MAQTAEKRFSNVLFYGVVICLAYLVFRIFQPFLVPLGWAVVLGVIFYSLNKRVERKWGRTRSAVVITFGVTLVLIVPTLLLAAMFVREGISAAVDIQSAMAGGGYGWLSHARDWLASHIAAGGITVDLPELIRQGARRAGEYLATELGAVIRNTVVFVFELFVMLFALFYFLRDGDAMLRRFRSFLPFDEDMTDRMLGEARELIFASVTTSLVIAGAQGIICGAAFAIVGLGSPVFWGVLMGFLSLLPVVGAWPVWIPGAIYLFSTGHMWRAIILIIICGALGGTIDNVLRPLLLGGRASLNGLLVFISVLGGIAVFGVLGVVMGPIVVATAVGILDVYSGNDVAKSVPDASGV